MLHMCLWAHLKALEANHSHATTKKTHISALGSACTYTLCNTAVQIGHNYHSCVDTICSGCMHKHTAIYIAICCTIQGHHHSETYVQRVTCHNFAVAAAHTLCTASCLMYRQTGPPLAANYYVYVDKLILLTKRSAYFCCYLSVALSVAMHPTILLAVYRSIYSV
jgi:hypothetical protein